MSISLIKNKIIIAIFGSLLIVFSALLFTGADFNYLLRAKNFLAEVNLNFQKDVSSLKKIFTAFAQEISPYFFPRYPQRLMYLADEISLAAGDLAFLNESLNNSLDECDCKFTQSQCSSTYGALTCLPLPGLSSVFGDPCKNRTEIKEKQSEISEKTKELTYLQNLLKKEMESGLRRELESLSPEEAEELRVNLEKILQDSQEVVSLAENNSNLPEDCSANRCLANCLPGSVTELDACFGVKGEQKPIEFRFKLGVGLNDLDLGQIRVRNINLSLPKEIEIARLGSLSTFNIAGEEFVIPIKEPQKTLRLQVPKPPSLPQPPSLTLGCPGAQPTTCTYAKPVWEEPWCYCDEGWRPLGANRTGEPKGDRGGDCADFSFESPNTKVYGYTGNETYGDWVYVAKDSCTEIGTREDGLANGPRDIIDQCQWQTEGTYKNPGGRSAWECDLTGQTGTLHGGIYRNVARTADDPEASNWWHLCAKCEEPCNGKPGEPGCPYYGTEYNQCSGKVE
jgi:hypothetical protein